MGVLEQLKEALSHTVKLTKDASFTTDYSKDEQEFFRSYIKELHEEINAELEAVDFIRQRDMDKQHEVV